MAKDRINKPLEEKPDNLQKLKDFSDEQMRKHGPTHFLLDDSGNVVPASLFEWCFWYEKSRQRVIQQDYVEDCKCSTVFTGLDMGYRLLPGGKPLVFETMVFGAEYVGDFFGKPMTFRPELQTYRCSTLAEALAQHQAGLEWLKGFLARVPAGERHKRQLDTEDDEPGPGPDDVPDGQKSSDYRRSHQEPIEGSE